MSDPAFWKGKQVLVTGGAGFIGSAVVDHLVQACGVPKGRIRVPRSADTDLRQLDAARRAAEGCQVVIHLAAVTGGISFSRSKPATQYRDSTFIDCNVAEAARLAGVQKMVAIGNLFAYASDAPMPLREATLLDGMPTEAHRGVGWMKRNLAVMANLYVREHKLPIAVVYSANAYGPRDSLDPQYGHVIPATIMKCFREKELQVWGDGSPTRDFLFVDDIAAGLVTAAERLAPGAVVNIGSGAEVSIKDLVYHIVRATGFAGPVSFDASKGGGDARRCADITQARSLMGFAPTIGMEEGMRRTVAWYRTQLGAA